MIKTDVLRELITAIGDNQKMNGITDSAIVASTRPMTDLDNFDSMTAIEVLADFEQTLEEKYSMECDLDVIMFYNEQGEKGMSKKMTHHTLTIDQITENIYNKLIKGGL